MLRHVGRLLGAALVLSLATVGLARAEQGIGEGSFTTNDGVRLHYLESGSGRPLVMIPGWSQSAAQFHDQLTGLAGQFHVIAIDMRGHGESDRPDHGYHIQRLAEDVHEFLVGKNLTGVALAGHSMGTSVIWSYWEMFGPDRLSRLILVDQMPMITADPAWSAQEKQNAGAIFDPKSAFDTADALAGPDGRKVTEGFLAAMFTKQYPRDRLAWVVEENMKFPRVYAAALLLNHAMQDWRHTVPTITLPTLVIGGKASIIPWQSQVWVADNIKGAHAEIFEASEGGSHFMFMENPEKFNHLVASFLGS